MIIMKRKLTTILSLCLTASLILAGCGNGAASQESAGAETSAAVESSAKAEKTAAKEAGPVTFTDAMGQEITVENPQRVVALMGSFAEIWTLAGGSDTLVGVTDDAFDERDFIDKDKVSSVGTFQNPSTEQILALEPDLVLLSAETKGTDSHVALKDALADAGVTAAYFSVTHFEDYLAMLKTCTDITGDSEAYKTNGLAVQEKIDAAIKDGKRTDNPSVLLMITYSGGIRPQTSDSMTGKMLADLGYHNILDDNPSLLKDFSVENIIEADPDYILVIPMGNDDAAAEAALKENLESNPAWSTLTAVENGHYILLPKDKFLYKPNARWAESYTYLTEELGE